MRTGATETVERLLPQVQTVLLDFDGPVCSIFAGYPAPVVAGELAAASASAGYPVPERFLESQDPLDVLRYAGTVGPQLTALVERELSRAELEAAETAEATPGAGQLLLACRSTGRRVAIVSNNSAEAVARFLIRAGWTDRIEQVEGRDPSEPRLMKPHPHVLLRALDALKVTAETAAIVGDSVTDIEAGRAASVHTIGYANRPGKDLLLQSAGAEALVYSMTDFARTTATRTATHR